jgi:rubrerythrin
MGSEVQTEVGKVKTWMCPVCGYLIDNIVFEQARFDYGCPRCKEPLMHFERWLEKKRIKTT